MDNYFEELIQQFNDNNLDVVTLFGSYETWFNIVAKRGLLSEIDWEGDSDEWQNKFLIIVNKYDKPLFYQIVSQSLSDVIVENGKFFYNTKDRSELSYLFCKDHEFTVSKVLGEGEFFEFFDYYTGTNVYDEIISNLNETNKNKLIEIIVDSLKNDKVEPSTDLMVDIASNQGHEDYLNINLESMSEILKDEKSTKKILDLVDDTESNLLSLYNNSANNAYESEIYDKVFNALSEYFEGRGEWIEKKTKKPDTTYYEWKVPIVDFEYQILDYLEDSSGWGYQGTLHYQGSYINILKEFKECLRVWFPDYPDWRKTIENINEYFSDYI